ncbi:Dihydrolipoyllysine-residue acetyltransferase component of pyruvate dehydrogenase complex, mitochondrial [Camponotus floridanus]|uniref:Dihydrolipoamide acetyltransferase component of pyruvate dehydrogenase complex n=1 Tax=Camponotus floridanus TaxID=104421 RepID=E2A8V0_CAMFO|nr:dihydrolipoyllysine-residue acetyltransferase component of pyruvate dehydrogenase complex, mitochondrial [Camponotus floridanus]EFN70179.1 Dihydrolipoyllysine-residue acetyltransferase component of pyruvate dehydrogenase complex, mitochondrial [Camponotus floridanus]
MAHIIRSKLMLLSLKYTSCVAPRILVPLKHQRLCFHTTRILDVKGKELLMPSLSPTMETGTIVKWFKKEGDSINPGDAIADIQTDKAIVTMEFDDEGVLAKIIVPEGTKDIKVGTLIALTVEADEDWKSVEVPDKSVEPAPKIAAASVEKSPAVTKVEAPPPGQQNIPMPALSPTMTTGTIIKWLKQEGDEIQPGDALADIQTDKAVMTFELEEEGVLAKILVPEGSEVQIGQLIAVTVEKGMDWKQAVIPTSTKPGAAVAPSSAQPTAPIDAKPSSGQVYGLAVKRLLEEYSLNSDSIKGTGRTNRLLKSDVLEYIQAHSIQKVAPKSVPAPKTDEARSPSPAKTPVPSGQPSPYKDIEISNIRAVIAKRLSEAKRTIPHSYAVMDITIDKLVELRGKLKTEDINVSVNDFITKAVAHALVECPDINTLYKNDQIIRVPKVDVCVAVATPTGLITPIVFDTATKNLADISKNIRELAEKARKGQLKPHEFQGGTFTISNLGMFGIKEFSAIINPPQTAILAVGSGREELDSSLTKLTKMAVQLSYDRRAIDEDQAANFLAVVRAMLEDPAFLVAGKTQALRYKRDAY